MKKPNSRRKKDDNYKIFRQILVWLLIFIVIINLSSLFSALQDRQKLTYSQFYNMLKSNPQNGAIVYVKKIDNLIEGKIREGKEEKVFYVYVPENDKELIELLKRNVQNFEIEPPKTMLMTFIYYFAPTLIFILFLWFFASRGSKQMGGSIWSFGKVKAKLTSVDKKKVTFEDVAGVDEAKEELEEVIEFLKDPNRFRKLGGKIPKGVLLVGPPGCGKTLLAKAVAGEAGVPFYSISGSDFVELFVGVGASRVRDLFEQARKASRISGKGCIVFIDEIDAVGRQRFAGIGGGHDEREQTLNQLLVEMDGFGSAENIIIMAATNRPDVLDPALLRPGRFDRHIVVDRPDIKGREEILKVHIRAIKLSSKVDLSSIARQTSGFSGADLANLCNEAALLAARRNKQEVGMEEMEESIERVMAGPQRKSRVIPERERKTVAIHESGHALLSVLLPEVDPLHKVSIIPRGVGALGYTMQLPLEDRYIISQKELLARICVLLGGRAAEWILLGDVTSGAANDLEVATSIARRMVTEFGMSHRLGNVTLGHREGPVFLGKDLIERKDYSEETSRLIDEEIRKIVDDSYNKAVGILRENLSRLKSLAEALLEREILTAEEVKRIVGIEKDRGESNGKGEDASSQSLNRESLSFKKDANSDT